MSAKDEYYTWHLTPDGWVKGTEKENGKTTEKTVPANAVLSLEFHEYSSGSLGPGSQFNRWIDTKTLDATKAELLKKQYGPIPEEMSYFECTK